ncbi:MAG: LPXTG cell wall anchor domain-containing protein [Actinobacteria bacterium]|nr:LPXTG cell wall anchor domain-containing protein [Actinomycetota bacterium]
MKPLSRTRTAFTAVLALTVLPAGAAFAQEDCEVVQGPGSAAGDVECAGETGVLPGRFDRPDAAPADEDEDSAGAPAGAPAVESTDAELAATGIDADTAALAALGALALGGGALAAGRRRTRTES